MDEYETPAPRDADTVTSGRAAWWENDDTIDVPPVSKGRGRRPGSDAVHDDAESRSSGSWEHWLGDSADSSAADTSYPDGESFVQGDGEVDDEWPFEFSESRDRGRSRAVAPRQGSGGWRLGRAVSGRVVLLAAVVVVGAIALVWFASAPPTAPGDGGDVESDVDTTVEQSVLAPPPNEPADISGGPTNGALAAPIPGETGTDAPDVAAHAETESSALSAASQFLAGFGTPTLSDARAHEEFQSAIAVPERRDEFVSAAKRTRAAVDAELQAQGVGTDAPFVFEIRPLRRSVDAVHADAATVRILAFTVFAIGGVGDVRTGFVDYAFELERQDGDWRVVSVDVAPRAASDPSLLERLLLSDEAPGARAEGG